MPIINWLNQKIFLYTAIFNIQYIGIAFIKAGYSRELGVIRKVNVKGFIGWKIIDWFGELEYF